MKKKVYLQPKFIIIEAILDSEIAIFNVLSSASNDDITAQYTGAWEGLWE